jgi:hypothetical protein
MARPPSIGSASAGSSRPPTADLRCRLGQEVERPQWVPGRGRANTGDNMALTMQAVDEGSSGPALDGPAGVPADRDELVPRGRPQVRWPRFMGRQRETRASHILKLQIVSWRARRGWRGPARRRCGVCGCWSRRRFATCAAGMLRNESVLDRRQGAMLTVIALKMAHTRSSTTHLAHMGPSAARPDQVNLRLISRRTSCSPTSPGRSPMRAGARAPCSGTTDQLERGSRRPESCEAGASPVSS